MATPLHRLTEALQMPELSLRRLADCEPRLRLNGTPALQRTTHTIEAEVRLQGREYLVALPLHTTAAHHLERTLKRITPLRHKALAPISLLHEELTWRDELGNTHRSDLWLQELPGEPLTTRFTQLGTPEQLRAFNHLERTLETLGISHNNLKEENLRWTGEELVIIRPWDATFDEDHARDKAFFATQRAALRLDLQTLSDCEAEYEAANEEPTSRRWEGHLFEGLIAIETDAGFGFANNEGEVVIEPRYAWVGDFYEGRAVVKEGEKMGVIDRTGGYILEPQYEVIEYRAAESRFWVRNEGLWAEFDYNGRQVSEFSDDYEI